LAARFDFGAHPDLLASFPFPHELRIEASVEAATLRVDTTLVPTADRPVPISFGYHPYLRPPGERRENVRLRLPERRHLELDDRQLPTGRVHVEEAEDEPVGTRTFDDLYELGDDRRLALTGGGRRLVLELGDGYGHAQVFTPPAAESICLEPMTAPVNGLVDGACALAKPGTSFTATFWLRVDDER
jgi:galactose mutarotase-like enzyme